MLLAGMLLSFFNLGAWGALYAATPEIYPTLLRATGAGWAAGFGRIASILELGVLVGQVEVGFFELPLRLAEIVGHAVEGADQHADLVVAARLNLVGEVAGGDLPCALGQLLDRARDPTRQIEREPREREHDDQGHQQE